MTGLNTAASNNSAVYSNGVRTCVSLIFDSYYCIDLALHLLLRKLCLQSPITNDKLCKANKFNSSHFVKYPLYQKRIQVKGREKK